MKHKLHCNSLAKMSIELNKFETSKLSKVSKPGPASRPGAGTRPGLRKNRKR